MFLHPQGTRWYTRSLGPGCGKSQPSMLEVITQSVHQSVMSCQPTQSPLPGEDRATIMPLPSALGQDTWVHHQLSSHSFEKRYCWRKNNQVLKATAEISVAKSRPVIFSKWLLRKQHKTGMNTNYELTETTGQMACSKKKDPASAKLTFLHRQSNNTLMYCAMNATYSTNQYVL